MSDELKEFLRRELEELKQNKIRVAAIGVCLVVLIGVWLTDDSPRGEEIDLNTVPATAPPATKDLPAKPLPVSNAIEGVTPVLGANADVLVIADPFAGVDKPKPPPQPVKPVNFQPPPIIPQPPHEKVTLTGTALGANKTAMFLRGKQTIFLTIGDEINGRQIVDITADFVAFADGGRVYLQKDVN